MLTLHHYPGNASLAPHIVLEEIGAPYALQLVDRARNLHKSPEYLRLNPNGLIPVLVDGDLVIYESVAITLHLVDTHAAAGLAPRVGTPERAHFYQWMVWLTSTLQATLIHYFYPERLVDDGNHDGAGQVKAHAAQKAGAMLELLDAQLASHADRSAAREDGGPWLLASGYTAADAHALMLCRWTRGFGRPARALPHLGPYLQRMLQRDAVRRASAQEGLQAPLV